MGMGIVSDKDFDSALTDCVNPKPKPVPIAQIVDITRPGRKEGDVNVPDSLRQIIGDTNVTDGRQEAVALGKSFGISPSAVSAYAHGATSTASYDKQPNKSTITGAKERIAKKARAKLMLALTKLTPEKLDSAKARDIAGIARDMSQVMKNVEPDSSINSGVNTGGGPAFVFYAPQTREEKSYDIIQAKE
jgi:predicted transcriptional regulator